MIYLKPVLDKRYKKADETYPIVFRISYNRKVRDISTGLSCKSEDFDERFNCIKVTTPELETIQERLNIWRLKYQERLLEFEKNLLENGSSVQDIKNYLTGAVTRKTTIREFWVTEIQNLKKANRFGNARSYEGVLSALEKTSPLDIPFKKITYSWVSHLDTELRSRGLKLNTISVYMRTLRALYNKAIRDGIADQDDYPFNRYKIPKGKTAPRVASIEELQRYFCLDVKEEDWEFDHWNYGKLILLIQGVNFKDLALLTSDNIKKDRIVYNRSKTNKLISVKILPEVLTIIEYYKDPERLTLFPIFTNEQFLDKSCHPDRICQLRKNTNKWLKRLGKRAKIEEPLTSYTFRYSLANAYKTLGYSKDLIAEALSHQYGNSITGIYLEQFDLELVDQMNSHLASIVLKKGDG